MDEIKSSSDKSENSNNLITKFLSSRGRKRIGRFYMKQEHKKRFVIEERNYEKIFMNKTTIFLPFGFKPYSTQKLMMVKLLNALNTKSNVLIESPTGSGKTIALLSSSCAWLIKYKKERDERRQTCPRHGINDFTLKNDTNDSSSVNTEEKENVLAKKLIESKTNYSANNKSKNNTLKNNSFSDVEVTPISTDNKDIQFIEEILVNKSAFDEMNAEFQNDFEPICDSRESIVNSKIKNNDAESFSKKNEEEAFNSSSNMTNKSKCTCLPRAIIYYGTRTHKQIEQVIKEYKRLPFGEDATLKHTILASRDHGCVNPIAKNKSDVKEYCKELLSHEGTGCTFRNDLRKYDNYAQKLRNFVEENGGERVWDMEDLVQSLSESRPSLCPYFAATRTFTIDADLVFCPFNYLIDPIIRRSSDVHLKNSIVILDEAHNVEDICRDSASFELKEQELIFCLENLTDKEELILKKIRELVEHGNSRTSNYQHNEKEEEILLNRSELSSEELSEILTKYHKSIALLLHFGQLLYNWFKNMSLDTLSTSSQRYDGSYNKTYGYDKLIEFLKNDKRPTEALLLNSEEFKTLIDAWLHVAQKERSVLDDQGKQTKNRLLDSLNDPIPDLFRPAQAAYLSFEKFITFLQFFSIKSNQGFYKCNILIERFNLINSTQFQEQTNFLNKKRGRFLGMRSQRQTQYSSNNWLNSSSPAMKYELIKPNFDITLSLWCMFPSVAFDAFKECQSVILASGTLCPTETLKTELGLEFNGEMEGSQVINKEQIFATVLSSGPTGTRLNATYRNIVNESNFMIELAHVIVDICLTVPKGILCFVSSYNVLNILKKSIENHKLILSLQARKVIFEEPRRSSDLPLTLLSFEEAIKDPKNYGPECDGALMLAVFRGKVSEGIDFADDKARCVICVGIPYPNSRDELVIQKKRFNDENSKIIKILNGDEWYSTQAYRALNQALGRCLRHKDDWGALVLIDERFEVKANSRCADSKKISRWVRDQLVIYKDYNKFKTELNNFILKMSPELKFDCSNVFNDNQKSNNVDFKPLIEIV